jgi:hypothetical protein
VRRAAPLAFVLLLLAPAVARADFKDWSFTLTPLYAISYIDSRTAQGGGGALAVDFGLTDALSLQASSSLTWQPVGASKTAGQGTLAAYTAMVGLHYVIDVIRLQPSFDLALGAVGFRGSADFGDPGGKVLKPLDTFAVALGFAVDWLVTRHVAVGAEVRYHILLTALDEVPMHLYVGPRVTFTVGN